MRIELSPADAGYISQLVKNGYFANEEEAVLATIRNAREKYENKHQELLVALAEGDADIAAGRVVDYTPTLLDELLQEVMQNVASGKAIEYDSNVIP